MPYTANKKPSGLDAATTPLVGANEIVLSQAGNVTRASLTSVEAMVHAANAKTTKNPVDGTEVVTVRQTDNVLRQVALDNIVKPLSITNAMVATNAGIVDTKLAQINTADKVTNQAVGATSALSGGAYSNAIGANKIVARDGSGNFGAGTITATLSGNATTATTLATGRTIQMTGDVTYTSPTFNGSANVTAAATITNDAVTTAKILNLNVTTGKIADDAVTFAKMQNSAAAGLSVVGRNINSAGDFAEINAGTDGHVLRRSGTGLAFGQIVEAGITDGAVTNVKIASGVDAAKLTTGTLPIARIADGAVTNAKLASDIDAAKLTTGTLPIARIADGAVTNAKLASDIDAAKITTGTLPIARIADGGVTLSKLVAAVQQALVPAGAVQAFAMNSAPSGWLSCNGSNVSRSTYSALFSAIGTTYGSGDGSTTFTLPDLRGYFLRGSGTNSDGTAAGTFGAKTADALKTHTHSVSGNTGTQSADHTHSVSGTTGNDSPDHGHAGYTDVQGNHQHTIRAKEATTGSGSGAFQRVIGLAFEGETGFTADDGNAFTAGAHSHNIQTYGAQQRHQHPFSATSGGVSANHTHAISLTSGNPSTGTSDETRPKNIAMLYCIKF